jgi:hypothetical protein
MLLSTSLVTNLVVFSLAEPVALVHLVSRVTTAGLRALVDGSSRSVGSASIYARIELTCFGGYPKNFVEIRLRVPQANTTG